MRKKFLAVILSALLLSAIGVYYYLSQDGSNPKTFVFEWSSEEQNIVDATLRMELNFSVDEENLSIIAKIKDTNASHTSYLVLVFDMNQSGKIEFKEPCYVFDSAKYSRSPSRTNNAWWDGYGGYEWACFPEASPYHNCTRDESGITFNISIPRAELDLTNDLAIVSYLSNGVVWKQFNFGLEV